MMNQIIGDGSGEYSFFEGYFDGGGHKLSDFEIVSEGGQYVGLFGILQANVSNSVGGTVYRLGLENYKIKAVSYGASVFCGSYAGYALGSSLILCDATGGTVEVHSGVNDFAYAGGLIGFQQGLDNGGLTYLSAITYCSADVNVDCREGAVYCAGGITGYIVGSNGGAVASVNNSYSLGNVQGAMISGGIAGYMGAETCITTCYSTGIISAQTGISDRDNNLKYCHAYAGGIAGLAGEDTVVSDSFAVGKIYCRAELGSAYAHKDGILGAAETVPDGKYGVYAPTMVGCVYAEGGNDGETVITSGAFLKETLHWNECDWVFAEGAFPTVNTAESVEYTFDITIKFPGLEDTTVTEMDAYLPLSFWYGEDILPSRLSAPGNDTRTSYGYYFDEALTLRVPASYVPTRDITLYAAVADHAEVAGTYVILGTQASRPAYITLFTDGTFEYTDAGDVRRSVYRYDGSTVVLLDCRLSRYRAFDGYVEKYGYDNFGGRVTDGVLELYGGTISDGTTEAAAFTEAFPLRAVSSENALVGTYSRPGKVFVFSQDGTGTLRRDGGKTEDVTYVRDGSTVTITVGTETLSGVFYEDGTLKFGEDTFAPADAFAGSWNTSLGEDKLFILDGTGGWIYEYSGIVKTSVSTADKIIFERKTGTYTVVSETEIRLFGDLEGSATVGKDSSLVFDIGESTFVTYRNEGRTGKWSYPDYGMTLYLGGIGISGKGNARVEFLYGNGTVEFYDLVYAPDDLGADLVCLYYGDDLFGLAEYDPATGTLVSASYVGPLGSFVRNIPLCREDEMVGEWVSENEDIPLLGFNGYGSYDTAGGPSGKVLVNGEDCAYTLDIGTLSGTIVRGEKIYFVYLNAAENALYLTDGETRTKYVRKDALGDTVLSDGNGNTYTFDGRGELPGGGTMTLTDASGNKTTYIYRVGESGVTVLKDGTEVGSIVKDAGRGLYVADIGGESVSLGIKTLYTGKWAMSGSLEALVIGDSDLDGRAQGKINGRDTVFTEGDGCLTFEYSGTTFYIVALGEGDLVISQYREWYLYSDTIYCAPVDDVFGKWENSLGAAVEFDGMSASNLTSGTAQSGVGENLIYYYYVYDRYGQYILWSVDENGGSTEISRLVFCPVTERLVYKRGDRAFRVEKGDALYDSAFLDEESGKEYTFDGFGGIITSAGETYAYTVVSLDRQSAKATVTITIDGVAVTADLDFSEAGAFRLVFRK